MVANLRLEILMHRGAYVFGEEVFGGADTIATTSL